jgi:hypothetical protein
MLLMTHVWRLESFIFIAYPWIKISEQFCCLSKNAFFDEILDEKWPDLEWWKLGGKWHFIRPRHFPQFWFVETFPIFGTTVQDYRNNFPHFLNFFLVKVSQRANQQILDNVFLKNGPFYFWGKYVPTQDGLFITISINDGCWCFGNGFQEPIIQNIFFNFKLICKTF